VTTLGWSLTGCSETTPRVVRVTEPPVEQLEGTPFDPAITPPYHLSPGDELLIRFPTDPTLDQEVLIRSDGKISLPYVGDIQAAPREPEQLAADIDERMKPVLADPQTAVIVMQEKSRVVFVSGQVKLPSAIPLRPSQTLLQTVVEAGGTTSTANIEQVIVLRSVPDDATYVLSVDLAQVLAGKAADLRLHPFDVVHVPQTIIAQVDLFVEQYINLIIPRSVSFPFITELHSQPLEVINDGGQFDAPPIQLTR
jgi:protein involved in polysaccharide export with SLBB domain